MKNEQTKNIVLVYSPFCSPASPPYSIANIYSFLKENLDNNFKISALDLNIEFHEKVFEKYQTFFKKNPNSNLSLYKTTVKKYFSESKKIYSENNKKIVHNQLPDQFNELFQQIVSLNPTCVVFSLVYSSQTFYATAIIKELKKRKIKTIVGGPAATEIVNHLADEFFEDSKELLNYFGDSQSRQSNNKRIIDFNIFALSKYFTPKIVLPIKTSNACYYKKCAFCTHHKNKKYEEFSLDEIKETIVFSKQKYFFFIDDMIHKKRLLDIAKMIKPLKVKWICQLSPTSDLDFETLKILHDSGLRIVLWGIESGSDKIIKLMNKGTNRGAIEIVIKNSHEAGIKNITFIMFGFPGETKEDFLETIDFLKKNESYINLVCTSLFGLQKDSPIFNDPNKFGIKIIEGDARTVLEPKITYDVSKGLTSAQAIELRKKHSKSIDKINKYPNEMNFFREHMLTLD